MYLKTSCSELSLEKKRSFSVYNYVSVVYRYSELIYIYILFLEFLYFSYIHIYILIGVYMLDHVLHSFIIILY